MGNTPITGRAPSDPPAGQCWCCGSIDDPERMVHLGDHPEVTMCLPCARWAAKEAWELEDRGKTGSLAKMRHRLRQLRRGVIHRGWHRHHVLGRPVRWLGKHLP
jgi:hypothetical protein